ncbi:M56 family metallopeptidase [Dyadobacter psychrophilus]|uniref:Signal transducer regulating beta-lactamase production, contains metallopeptidase domain n=1 Tax=Dyadobacter psychrophilus TaxID=651661 RepID=A0A1T5EDG4_9BACT|nr:M56 family metallopeptidase [Dyadobacter psychrophilus]SKB81934.1 Signal transducer regulating beta-lactamase production, contains metallopeptidase domain [Dyadobacter psychrophilus]
MAIDFSDPHYFHPLAKAFCWTLIHSLWQGLIVALLSGIILLLTAKCRPALRYNLFAALLLAFVIVNAATFLLAYKKELVNNSQSSAVSVAIDPTLLKIHFNVKHTEISFINRISQFLDHYQMQIIAVWLMFFLFKSARTVTGLLYINKIRHRNVRVADDAWNWQVRQLAAKMGIYQRILLLESGLLQTPILQGIFRPVIIVPLGFLTSLPQDQVEAILLHELAHVRRHDYLVNLLQSLGENLYFFNPAFLWLSALMRMERENCCDDLVIDITKERNTLVQALVSFHASKQAVTSPGLSFIGTNNYLLNRIKRIIYNTNKQLNTMEKFSILSSLIAVAFISAAYLTPVKQVNTSSIAVIQPKPAKQETIRPTLVKAKMKTPASAEKPVAIEKHKSLSDSLSDIKSLLAELKTAIDTKDLKKADALRYKAYLAVWEEKSDIHSKTLQTKLLADAFEKRKEQLAKNTILANVQNDMISSSSQTLAKRSAEIDVLYKEMEALALENHGNRKAREVEMQEDLIEDLLAEGIITTRENLSYKLHNMFLIVNGVEQPESLHQKLKAKYLERSWTEWVYNWDGATGLRYTGVRYNG